LTLDVSANGQVGINFSLAGDQAFIPLDDVQDTPEPPAPPPAHPGVTRIPVFAPGDYTVFAFDRLDDLEYAKPDVLLPYLPQAAHVRVDRGGGATVSVKLIHREQH
jgi:hypothetical protein